MAVAAKPEIARILLDLGIEPVDVYAMENAEATYMSALKEGIATIEVASKDKAGDERSRILREEIKRLRDKKREKVNVGKLIGKKTILPASKIKPQALLPAAEEKKSPWSGIKKSVDGILNILKLGNKQDREDSKADRKERQRQKKEKREKLIEGLGKGVKGAADAGAKVVSTLVSPFQGILSTITNFLKFTLLGILFNKGLAWFSDPENQKKITNFGRFLKDWWPTLLAGFTLFFTPIGTLVAGVTKLLIWAIPALVRLIAANPWLAAGAVLVGGGMMAHNRIKKNREAFNEQDGDSTLTVDEFRQQDDQSRVDVTPSQAYSETGSFPGMMNFAEGGQVLGPEGRDVIPAMLSNNEFVVSAPAVESFGPGLFGLLNAIGGGTNKSKVEDGTVFAEGGGFLGPMGELGSRVRGNTQDSNDGTSRWLPVKSGGMVAVPPRPRRNPPEVIELPTKVTDLRKSKKVISGTTIPQFKITSNQSIRNMIRQDLLEPNVGV